MSAAPPADLDKNVLQELEGYCPSTIKNIKLTVIYKLFGPFQRFELFLGLFVHKWQSTSVETKKPVMANLRQH